MNFDQTYDPCCLAVALVVVGYFIYCIRGRMKGWVDVRLDRKEALAGEEILGEVVLRARKPVIIKRIVLRFLALQSHDSERGRRVEHKQNAIYIARVNLDVTGEYLPGNDHRFPFRVKAPDVNNPKTGRFWETLNNMAASFNFDSDKKLFWRLEARVDAKGANLVGVQIIDILPRPKLATK